MVLSLVDLSLSSIASGIKNGTIQHPHLLPPKLRQQVLDKVLKRRLINDPKCMAHLSSVEFMNGMETFGIEHGEYDLVFLNRLEETIATVLPNGETVGAGIRKLNLSVHGCKAIFGHGWLSSSYVKASSFPLVSRLINQCPNTTSLALRGIRSDKVFEDRLRSNGGRYNIWLPSVLNENNVCTGVMENLVELSVRDFNNVLISDHPLINFNRLTTLKLDNCSIQVSIWADFLRSVPTLENLQMIGVRCVKDDDDLGIRCHPDVYGLDWVLPTSMPHLKSLEIVSLEKNQFIFQCNKAFVDNLMGCPEIRRVQLSLDEKSIDEECMEQLANMNIDLTLKLRFTVYFGNEDIRAALDSSSKFKVVRIFHERMDSFELDVHRKWSPELSAALEDVINSCWNLTTFGLQIPNEFNGSDPTEIDPVEMNRINAAMIQFFGNQERATQLKDLCLWGNFDDAVMLAVSEYCLNLDRLEVWLCPALRDHHFIDWVSNGGGRLKHLEVRSCPNITSEGIIPILAKSAEGLFRIAVFQVRDRNWETVLSNLCPYAKYW